MIPNKPAARLLMCAPEHFAVSYAINPWMDPASWANDRDAQAAASRREWAALHRTLIAHGAEIELEGGYVIARAPRGLTGNKIKLSKVSVGATPNALIAAVLARGWTLIEKAARETRRIVVAEEHLSRGGLGSYVAATVAENCPAHMRFIGLDDTYADQYLPLLVAEGIGRACAAPHH